MEASNKKLSTIGAAIRQNRQRTVLVIILLVIAAGAGILTGNWLSNTHKSSEDLAHLDEYIGVGKRTAIPGDLELTVNPVTLSVNHDDPIRVTLKLTNHSKQSMLLNNWFTPAPSDLRSNQMPFKVIVRGNGRNANYRGTMNILPPHKSGDFQTLDAGKSIDIPMELSQGSSAKGWDMSTPGLYSAEIWYETYLTGKYIGVNAWTGLTNHVVVQITVQGSEGMRH